MLFLPSPMRQVNLFLHSSDVEKAVVELARLEVFHLSGEESGEAAGETGRWTRLLGTYGDLEQRLDDLLSALGVDRSRAIPSRVGSPSGDITELSAKVQEAEQAIDSWRRRKMELAAEVLHLHRLVHEVRLLAPVEMPIEEIRAPAYLHWVVGTVPGENLATLRYALFAPPRKRKGPFGRTRTRTVNIFVHAPDIEEVAVSLIRLGNFHFRKAREETWSDRQPRWNELADRYSGQVRRLEEILAALEVEPPSLRPFEQAVPSRDAEGIEQRLAAVEAAVSDWRMRRQQAESEKERLETLVAELQGMASLAVPVEEMHNPAYLFWAIGRIPRENLRHLQAVLFRIPAVVLQIPGKGDRDLIVAATVREYAEILEQAMSGLFVESISFPPDIRGTPAACIRQLQEKLREVETVLADLEKERHRLEHRLSREALALWRLAGSNLEAAEAISGFARHGDIFLVSGRVAGHDLDSVAAALENATRGRAEIEILEPARHRGDAPVEMLLFRIPLLIIPVAREGDRQLIIAATAPKHADLLERALQAAFMEPIPLPGEIRGVPSKVLPELTRRLLENGNRMYDSRRIGDRLGAHWSERLLDLRCQVAASSAIVRAITRLSRHEETYLVSGWVAEADVDRVVATMDAATGGRAEVELVVPAAGGRRRPPTRMRNPALFRPFEAIVRNFGVPGYDEIDPTPLAALSFTLMYGMMFGDVGHGLMLVLLGLLSHRYGKGMFRSLGGVMVASGLSGMVFGFLYGTLFGREDLLPGLWIDPMDDIFDLLAVSVIGGVALLSAGYLAFMANTIRTRNWGELLFGRGGIAAAVFYWALIGGGYAVYRGVVPGLFLPAVLLPAGVLLFLKEPLSRWVMGERPLVKGDLRTMAIGGLFEVYESIQSHVSNTFSFVRLGAFAMTHAAFMQVIFFLAEAAGGGVVRWLIIVIGTLLVVGFEGLVVGIQALRLEYYEFFSKFYRGRGIAFKPFGFQEVVRE